MLKLSALNEIKIIHRRLEICTPVRFFLQRKAYPWLVKLLEKIIFVGAACISLMIYLCFIISCFESSDAFLDLKTEDFQKADGAAKALAGDDAEVGWVYDAMYCTLFFLTFSITES